MIVLHAGVFENNFLLWGETPEKTGTLAVKKSIGKAHSRAGSATAQPFPYDASAETLSTVLKEIGFDFKVTKKSIEPMTVWLPTVDNHPVPSSALIAEPPASTGTASLTPWKVTVLRLPPGKAVEFLCRSVGRQTLELGAIVGKDLSFWATAMRFAGALVAKQQFLPDVTEIPNTYSARWKPIFSGEDQARLSKLARTMPAVARALTREASTIPDSHPVSILSGFMNLMVDHLVRSSITTELEPTAAAKPKFPKKPVTHDSLHDQWLHTLC